MEQRSIQKVLIANRGEIAVRIIRTLKEMNIKTVAVYSEPDRSSVHVQMADEAVLLGPAPSKDSYLRGDKIIEICKKLKVDAIHPGFGFLSENANFAKLVTEQGIIFIGPSPYSIEIMGSKLKAKEAVKNYDIPMVPGTDKAIEDVDEAIEIAKGIGFPILIKASAGGGGKGMRVVEQQDQLADQMKRAISEALSSFGDGSVFIEKYVSSPRHIEIQVLGDQHGNYVHLYERECSIQRRHQKVIEEAPSAVLTEELRTKMGESAILVAKSCDYYGAGTVEFLLDANNNYYFLEMNTRLQVEHPVSELITGIDLVKEQILVAQGETLTMQQQDIPMNGHAIELRVYAEDPDNDFLPDVGTLSVYKTPKGPGVRVDDSFEAGMEIPIFYDPMIAKLIVFHDTREEAIARMKRAIEEYTIVGVKTTLPFGNFVMNHDAFTSGNFNTHFVKDYMEEYLNKDSDKEVLALGAEVAAYLMEAKKREMQETSNGESNQMSWFYNRKS